jgi:hypothetical protein
VVSVVVPLMLPVLPYARGRGFDSRSMFLFPEDGDEYLSSAGGPVFDGFLNPFRTEVLLCHQNQNAKKYW